MKTTTTSNLTQALKSKGYLGELGIPVVPLAMGLPITFDAVVKKDIDAVDEEEILKEVQREIDAIMGQLANEVEEALTSALMSNSWNWKGGSRDIYDTGALARSVKVSVTSDGISVSYAVPYANIVHNGGYVYPYGNLSARPIYLPARPWVSSVLYGEGPIPQFDFDGFLKRKLE